MNSSFLFYRILAVEAFLTDACLVQSARVVDTLSRRAHIWIWHLASHACIRMHMTRTWYTWYVSLFPSWSMCTWTLHLSQISCIWLCNSRATSLHVWPKNPRIWWRVRMHARLASSPHWQPGLFPSYTDSMLIKKLYVSIDLFPYAARPNKCISIYQQIRCSVANPPNPVLAPCTLMTPATTYQQITMDFLASFLPLAEPESFPHNSLVYVYTCIFNRLVTINHPKTCMPYTRI